MSTTFNNDLFISQLAIGKKIVTISSEEIHLLKDIPSQLKPIIITTCQQFSFPVVDFVPVGSSQRQTFFPGNRDIDIFIRLNTQDRNLLERFASQIIPALAQSLHTSYEIKYAENPYGVILYPIPNTNEYISVDVVVTIWIADQSKLSEILPISGMARTPFHMFYLQQHIIGLEEEIRLFKYWAKQKKLYRQSGFTGFISELLIIIYGSFQNLLSNANEISSLTYDFHGRSLPSLRKNYSTYPVILIDPVDPNRNAAAGIHGILGTLHLTRFKKIALDSFSDPQTLWQEYSLTGNIFTLNIEFIEGLSIKNDEEYYSRIIKVLGLVYRALQEQEITILDTIIDVKSSTLSFTTDSMGGGEINIRGPPINLTEHIEKFKANNSDYWISDGFYWSFKTQLTVQEVILKKIKSSELLRNINFI